MFRNIVLTLCLNRKVYIYEVLSTKVVTDIDVKEFYRSTEFVLPGDSRFRKFVGTTKSGAWFSCKRSIHCVDDLRRWCVKELPYAVYFMTSRFVNAKNVSFKRFRGPGFKWAHNNFIGSELYFDIDANDFNDSLEVTLRKSVELYSHLRETYDDIKLVFSGRGVHIWVLDFEKKTMLNYLSNKSDEHLSYPGNKEFIYYNVKKRVADKLHFDGYNCFKKDITINTRHVLKVPGSFNPKNFARVVIYNALPLWFVTYRDHDVRDLQQKSDVALETNKTGELQMIGASHGLTRHYDEVVGGLFAQPPLFGQSL